MPQKPTIITQTDSQLTIDRQEINLLRGNNEFAPGDVIRAGSDIDLEIGMVMGRISATGKLVPCLHSASDGSQYPAGLCYMGITTEKTVTAGDTESIELVYQGKVDASLINFEVTSTLDSVVTGRTLRDWLRDLGLVLIEAQEQTSFAN